MGQSTSQAGTSLDRIVAFLTEAGALAIFVGVLILAALATIGILTTIRARLRKRAEDAVHDIDRCNLRKRNVLDEDALALFRREDPVAWLSAICSWKKSYPLIGRVFPMADLDEKVHKAAHYLVAYLVVKENDLQMMPPEIKADLYRGLRELQTHLPLGTITKLLSILDKVGSLPTAFDYIPPDEVEERTDSGVRIFRDQLKETFERAQKNSTWGGLTKHLGLEADTPEMLAAHPQFVPEDIAYILCVFDSAKMETMRAQAGQLLPMLYHRFGAQFRQVACTVDAFLVADGELLRKIEVVLKPSVYDFGLAEIPAVEAYLETYGKCPFDTIGASYLEGSTALTRHYMQLLMSYQPETYDGDDLADRKIELIEAWKVIDDLRTAEVIG